MLELKLVIIVMSGQPVLLNGTVPGQAFRVQLPFGCAVVKCLARDREAAGSSLTDVTARWSLSKTHLS